MRNAMILGGFGRARVPAAGGGGGSPIVVESLTQGTAQTNSNTFDVTVTGCQAGECLAFGLMWFIGVGRTLSTATVSGEATDTNSSSQVDCANDARLRWITINSLSSGGSKTLNVTLSGNSDKCRAIAVRISGAHATPVGTIATGGNAFGDATINLSTAAAGSGILAICSTNTASMGVGSGYTTMGLTDQLGSDYGEYDVDVGGSGSKTVNWTGSGGVWAISALEIKRA